MIIIDVFTHQALEMPLIENDHMIEKIAPIVTNPALSNAILPWTLEARSLMLDAKAPDRINDFCIEVRTSIKDQIARCRVVRECFAQLLDYPCTCRMLSCIEVNDAPSVVRDYEEAIQCAEGMRRYGKKSIAAIASRWLLRNSAIVLPDQDCEALFASSAGQFSQ